MATIVSTRAVTPRDDRFFMTTAIVMAFVLVAGFSLQFAMGRSSFASPLLVHAHAVVFMGWVVFYVLQNAFVATGSMALHRRLGWIGACWMVAMVILGCLVTVAMVRDGRVPFFFQPLQFLILDPLTVLTFAGLTTAAIVMRRRTDWHRRLHYCGLALLLGPGLGRLLPMPFLIPWAYEATVAVSLIFPLIGVFADLRRRGSVHRAWWWGIGVTIGSMLLIEAISYGPAGVPIYRAITAGSAGAAVPALAYPAAPHLP